MKKKIFTLLTLALLSIGTAWADDVTLFTADFTNTKYDVTYPTDQYGSVSVTETDGTVVRFQGAKSSTAVAWSKENGITFTSNNINASAGLLTSSNPNYYVEIPLTGVNGSITVTTTGDATKWYYSYSYVDTGDENKVKVVARQQASDNNGFTISGLADSNMKLFIGSSSKKIKSITIKTPAAANAPTITTQPISATYALNETPAALAVDATASAGDLSYRWYSNTTNSTEGATAIEGATTATLAAANISTSSVGTTYYYCVVTDNNGSTTSSIASITVVNNYTVTYAIGEGTGVVPEAQTVSNGTEINLPKNFTMYKAGYTMTGWDEDGDGTADYEPGDSYTVTATKTLTAVYTSNGGTTLADRTMATTIKWGSWKQSLGVPPLHFEGGSGFVVAQASVAGKNIDVKLPINATTGKFKNQASNDWTQVNPGVVFTIPAAVGATITYKQYDNGATTIPEVTATGDTYELTAAGTSGSLYYEYIQVVLPGPSYGVDFTGLNNVTKTSGEDTVEGGTEYTATFAAAEGYGLPASVEVTAGGSDITANCTWTKATGTLTIPAAYTTGAIAITIEGVAIAGSSIIKATPTATNAATVTGTIGGTAEVNLQDGGSTGGYKFGGANHRLGVTLASGTFKTGDIINIHMTKKADNGIMQIFDGTGDGKSLVYEENNQGAVGNNFFVLPAAAEGKTTLAVIRTNADNDHKWNAYVDYVEVIRPVALTEEATNYTPVAATDATVSLIRTLSASYYNTFCVPFDIDLTDENSPLYGADVQEFDNVTGSILKFKAVTGTMDAGTPYLVKPAANVVNPVFTGVTVKEVESTTVSIANSESPGVNFQFKGTYNKVTLATDKTEQFLNTSGTFSYPSDTEHATMKGLRAYFIIPASVINNSGGAPELSISLDGGEEDVADGNTTVIDGIEYKNVKDGEYYNLAGQRVAQPTKGLYIVNGKKYIVK